MHPAHAPHSVPALKPLDEQLYVITCVCNPQRYHARYGHYRAFAKHVEDSGAELFTVEAAFGERPFEVTSENNPWHVQVRGTDLTEIWLKENLLNIGLRHLPAKAKYVAFVDADLHFLRPDWAQETLQQLQHHAAVQMFSDIVYLDSDHSTSRGGGQSFLSGWRDGASGAGSAGYGPEQPSGRPRRGGVTLGNLGAPGGCWAWRREALDGVGGLLDISIVGSGDYYMAMALLGRVEECLTANYTETFKSAVLQWQARAERHVRRNVGLVPGLIAHYWHGPWRGRAYGDRWQILVDSAFDPANDLTRDSQGLLRLHDDGSERFIALRDAQRSYFRQRNEDSIE